MRSDTEIPADVASSSSCAHSESDSRTPRIFLTSPSGDSRGRPRLCPLAHDQRSELHNGAIARRAAERRPLMSAFGSVR